MKKQYNTPKIEKVEFNYEENVVASNTPENGKWTGCKKWHGDNEWANSFMKCPPKCELY